mmetsp:Transcript_13251/g.38242  ORF Transcript_13251/g.38242 Transcript_13251/m.38242 type:complete len:295 (+) Transcript_13251:140-1024(+)
MGVQLDHGAPFADPLPYRLFPVGSSPLVTCLRWTRDGAVVVQVVVVVVCRQHHHLTTTVRMRMMWTRRPTRTGQPGGGCRASRHPMDPYKWTKTHSCVGWIWMACWNGWTRSLELGEPHRAAGQTHLLQCGAGGTIGTLRMTWGTASRPRARPCSSTSPPDSPTKTLARSNCGRPTGHGTPKQRHRSSHPSLSGLCPSPQLPLLGRRLMHQCPLGSAQTASLSGRNNTAFSRPRRRRRGSRKQVVMLTWLTLTTPVCPSCSQMRAWVGWRAPATTSSRRPCEPLKSCRAGRMPR